jgi:hypothetical protein
MPTLPEHTLVGEQIGVVVTRADGRVAVDRDVKPVLKDLVRVVVHTVNQIRTAREGNRDPK